MRRIISFSILLLVLFQSTSCATFTGGQVNTYQMTKPRHGGPRREIRVAPFVCDIFFMAGVGLIVDFSTGAIYRPEPTRW